jgi:predicted lipase
MFKKIFGKGLPAGIITTFSKGCLGYTPLENVPFSAHTNHIFNPQLAAWSINSTTYAYQDLCNKDNIIFPPEVKEGKLLFWHEDKRAKPEDKISSGYIGRIETNNDEVNRVLISFRGTQTTDEWILDADFDQVDVLFEPNGEIVKIHEGFWDIFSLPVNKEFPSLQDQIQKLLPLYLSETKPNEIYIAGHSMGSAVATLVLIDTVLNYPHAKVIANITGCPRIGNPAFADAMNSLSKNPHFDFVIWRIVNTEDIITTLPSPIFKNTLFSHLLKSETKAPNKIGLINFTKNLGKIFDNHHLYNYFYAMKNLISEQTKSKD